jgi:hypothetical protein
MSDNDAWYYQASFKIGQDMINVRANNCTEFVENLQSFQEAAVAEILSARQKLAGGDAVAQSLPVAGSAAVTDSKPVETNGTWSQPTSQSVEKPKCMHGTRVGGEGVNAKTGKPWRSWFCPQPKDAPESEKCKPIFFGPGTPEWDSWVKG